MGGAISSLLMLMYVNRGVLDKKNVGQVYTFGGAASICDGGQCVDGNHCTCSESNENKVIKLLN